MAQNISYSNNNHEVHMMYVYKIILLSAMFFINVDLDVCYKCCCPTEPFAQNNTTLHKSLCCISQISSPILIQNMTERRAILLLISRALCKSLWQSAQKLLFEEHINTRWKKVIKYIERKKGGMPYTLSQWHIYSK